MTNKQEIYQILKPGNGVVVSFGAHGEQYAHCCGTGRIGTTHGIPAPHRSRTVRIWRKATGRWTKPRKLHVAEVIRLATNDDMKKFKPDFGIAWDRD